MHFRKFVSDLPWYTHTLHTHMLHTHTNTHTHTQCQYSIITQWICYTWVTFHLSHVHVVSIPCLHMILLSCYPSPPLPPSLRKEVCNMKLPDMPMGAATYGATIHNNKVYISYAFGRDGNGKRVFPVHVYSIHEHKWSTLPEQQFDAAIVVLNKHITLIGGVDVSTQKVTPWCAGMVVVHRSPEQFVSLWIFDHWTTFPVRGAPHTQTGRDKAQMAGATILQAGSQGRASKTHYHGSV